MDNPHVGPELAQAYWSYGNSKSFFEMVADLTGSPYAPDALVREVTKSIEDCIHREVREEVGVEVDRLRYFASQSWPFPHSLMIAFNAEYVSGEARPCDDEIADVQWFKPDALPQLPGPVSISRKLIDATVARLTSR